MGLFGRKKAALPERDSHIEANLANSKIYCKDVKKIYHSAKGDTLAMENVNINVLENEFVSQTSHLNKCLCTLKIQYLPAK